MKKLICDRCGLDIIGKDDIDLAIEGGIAWEMSAKAHGAEARGIIPCENFIRCGGEMQIVNDNMFTRSYRWLMKLLNK